MYDVEYAYCMKFLCCYGSWSYNYYSTLMLQIPDISTFNT